MEYRADTIQTLLKDIKPYIKPAAISTKNWVLLTDEYGEEYKDTYYYMTDKFGMYKVPLGVSRFRTQFEAQINRQKIDTLRRGSRELIKVPFEKVRKYFDLNIRDYTLATSFTLDYDPDYGLVCHALSDNGLSKKINLTILQPFEEIAKDFIEYENYQLYLREGNTIVLVWSEEVLGFVIPIYADRYGNNKP
jgi:hypothetical protein